MSNEYKDWVEDLRNSPWDSEEHNTYLCMKYWFVMPDGYELKTVADYTKMSDMPIGWRCAFGIEFLDELYNALSKLSPTDRFLFTITCIKEKFGELRVYVTHSNEEIRNIIDKYTKLSRTTCIQCGAPATKVTTDWISPYCDKCVPKRMNGKEWDNVSLEEYWKEWEELINGEYVSYAGRDEK